MGIKTILAALCCIHYVALNAAAINKQKTQVIPKLKNPTTSLEDSEYYEQYEDRYEDSYAFESETATERLIEGVDDEEPPEEDATANKENNKNNDGRSAYINNQFVSDEQLSQVNSAPLHEVLQQQIEQVLAETEPGYSIYPPKEEKIPTHEQQNTINATTLNIYGNVSEDPDESTTNTLEKEEKEDNDTKPATNAYEPNQKPIVELPKPLYVALNTATTATPLLLATQSEGTEKPSSQYGTPAENCQLEIQPTAITSNNLVQKYKKRIAYETVSSTSQFVSTPLADLILKFSIGIVKPLRTTRFEDGRGGKIETQNYGDKVGYNGFKRNYFHRNANRDAKYRVRKFISRPSKISLNS